MLLFWSIAASCLLACVATLLWPLLRRPRESSAPDADVATVAIYRDQRSQLAHDRDNALISGEEFDRGVAELERRVGGEVRVLSPPDPAEPSSVRPAKREWPLATGLLLLVPIAAVALYLRLGNPTAVLLDPASGPMSERDIEAMVESLARKVAAKPDDAQGWVLLARSYQTLERFPQAADAYAHAQALVGDNADLLADYADALAMAQGRRLGGKPFELVQRALALDPGHRKALALAATGALERKDVPTALRYWRQLQAQLPVDSDDYRDVGVIIAELETPGRPAPGSPLLAKRDPFGPPAAAVPPPRPGISPPSQVVAEAAPASGAISGRVQLAFALGNRLAPSDVLFVYARAAQGSRMPLAILRVPAARLPLDFSLDDSMGMAAGAKLSSAAQVIVEARVSKSGNAMAQPGDLVGSSEVVKPGQTNVQISIDRVLP